MLWGNDLTFFCGCSNEGSPCQVVGTTVEPSRSLMNSEYCLFREEVKLGARYLDVVLQVLCHICHGDGFDMRPGYDTGGQWGYTAYGEAVEQCRLSGQDDG